jgi:glycosyltransferase involved in cell wall biosynthesis
VTSSNSRNSALSKLPASITLDFLLVIPSLKGGGSERKCELIATQLHKLGKSVLVVVLNSTQARNDFCFPVVSLGKLRVRHALWELIQILKVVKPNCTVSFMTNTNLAAIVSLLFSGQWKTTRVICNEEANFNLHKPNVIYRNLVRCLYPFADEVHCVSDLITLNMRLLIPKHAERIIRVPNPLDLERLRRASRQPISKSLTFRSNSTKTLKILYLGRLSYEKGVDVLVDSLSILKLENYPFEAMLIGSGPLRESLEKQIRTLNLERNVRIVGWLENPYPVLNACDVLVSPSRSEGYPNVLIEALALDKNIIATKSGGPVEIIRNTGSGKLVDINSPNQIAVALSESNNICHEPIQIRKLLAKHNSLSVVKKYYLKS